MSYRQMTSVMTFHLLEPMVVKPFGIKRGSIPPSTEQMGVKRHEAYHDLLEHSVRFRESDYHKNHKQANVAMDVIVNAKCSRQCGSSKSGIL